MKEFCAIDLAPLPETLVDLLSDRSLKQSNRTAYTFLQDGESESDRLTYEELDRRARAIAASLQSIAEPGDRALLLYPSGLEFISAFFGCLYAGIVAVPVYPPKRNQKMSRFEAIVTDAKATIILTASSLLATIQEHFKLPCLATDGIESDRAAGWQKPDLNGQSLAFLQYTSGSTATPKGVMVSHENLLYNEQTIELAFAHTEKTVFVGWLPLFHDMGLIGNVLQPMYLGVPSILMSPIAFLQKPVRWLQAISRYRATTSGGPNFAYDLCVRKIDPSMRAELDLSSWEVAFNGAEPILAQTLEEFTAAFAACGFRKEAFYPCYGMAEATLFISGAEKTSSPVFCSVDGVALEQNRAVVTSQKRDRARKLVSCGRAWLDGKIAIVNPETLMRCPEGRVGEIWVSGLHVARGYWNQPSQTKQIFNACIADTNEGSFLRTGDLGFLQAGELFVTGRLKDVIIIRGRNHYPQDIETTMASCHPALRPGYGAAFAVEVKGEERLVVVQELERSHLRQNDVSEVVRKISQAILTEHDLSIYSLVLVKTGTIPKTSSGKIQRRACRSRFLTGNLEIVRDWSESPQGKLTFLRLQSEVDFMLRQLKTGTQG